jgi:hypothetical protein
MSSNTLMRMLDSFMRRWWLYLVPVLLLAGFGAKTAAGTKDTFRSVGTLNVTSSTLVDKLSGVNNGANLGYDTPAQATTKQLASQLQTEKFITDVANRAGLTDQLKSGAITPLKIRASVGTFTEGSNLFHVVVTYPDPATAQKLAKGTIDAFTQSVLDANLADSASAIAFFDNQANTYSADVTAAQATLNEYVGAHPCTADCTRTRPDSESLQITQLTQAVTQAQQRYNDAVAKREEAKLTSDQTKSEVGFRLAVVDQPQLPIAREPKVKSMLLTFAMFVMLGLIVATGLVVVATALDQAVRAGSDLRDRIGVRGLATVPDAGTIPVVTGTVAELPRRATTAASERVPRRVVASQKPERGVRRGLDVVEDLPEPEPVSPAHGPRRIGVSRPTGTSPMVNSRRGSIGHRRTGLD